MSTSSDCAWNIVDREAIHDRLDGALPDPPPAPGEYRDDTAAAPMKRAPEVEA